MTIRATGRQDAGRGRLAVIFAAWTAVALLVAMQLQLRSITMNAAQPWLPVVGFELVYWYAWACLTPLIFALSRRLPFERGRWLKPLAIHTLIAGTLGLVLTGYFAALVRLFQNESLPWHDQAFAVIFVRYLGFGFHFDFLLYWAILGIGLALGYHELFQERAARAASLQVEASQLQTRLVQAQLDSLGVQLQPHFLFNTLHAISTLMEEDVGAARRMIARLSHLLRRTLENRRQHEVTLAEELDLLDCYLEIQTVRFQDRLRVERAIDAETLDAEVPVLILQPLVENAIRHGLNRRAGPGRIDIRAQRVDGRLALEVTDNGVGIPEPELASLKDGVGLGNVRGRLLQLYGDAAGLELENAEGGGLRVRVRLPYRRHAPAVDA